MLVFGFIFILCYLTQLGKNAQYVLYLHIVDKGLVVGVHAIGD
jgi:hypothetical protein